MVARIRFVGRELDQLVVGRRRVDVDDDAASQAAQVVVERPPRLVPHLLEDEILARRQLDQRRGASAQLGRDVPREHDDAVVWEHGVVAPGFVALH